MPEETDGRHLFVLDDTDLGGAEDAAVELEALLLDVEDGVVLLVGHGGHEGGLMLVGVEDLTIGVDALETVLLEGLEEDVLGHLETLVQVDQVIEVLGLLLGLELLLGNDAQGAVEVVDALNEVLGELLDGEVLGLLDVAGGALLEVAEIGDGAKALVLQRGGILCKWLVHHSCLETCVAAQEPTFHSRASASLASSCFLRAATPSSASPSFFSAPSSAFF